jgi:hypothetical protein
MRKDLLGWPGFNYQNWQNAAQFCADNNINLDEALVWAEKAFSEPFRNAAQGRKDFFTLKTKAAVLRAMKRDADADQVMDEAVAMSDAPVMGIHQYSTSLIAAGNKEKAMAIFRMNREVIGRRSSSPTSASPAATPRSATPKTRSPTGKSPSGTSRTTRSRTCQSTSRH